MNINHEPVATCLMIDIKHQPERVLIDVWLMFDEKCFFSRGAPAARQSVGCVPSPRWAGGSSCAPEIEFWSTFDIKHQTGMQFWLTCDIKHQPDRVLVGRGAPAPGCQGEGSSGAPERRACPWPPDTFF